jgi:hypothetical protein
MGLNTRGAHKAALSTDLLYKKPVSFPLVTSCWIKQAARRWTYGYVYRRDAGRRPGGRSVWPGPEEEGDRVCSWRIRRAGQRYNKRIREGGGEGTMTSICCLTCWRM